MNEITHSGPTHISDCLRSVLDSLANDLEDKSYRASLVETIKANDSRRWAAIRELYARTDTETFDPCLIDWTVTFTPIEFATWDEIRCLGLPFWPQFPIGKYFADFANPIKKIVIECDGAAFHSHAKDADRDRYMANDGWLVYRISGAYCNRIVTSPWEAIGDRALNNDDPEAKQIIHEWLHTTVDGLIAAIAFVHFARPCDKSEYFKQEAHSVLKNRLARQPA